MTQVRSTVREAFFAYVQDWRDTFDGLPGRAPLRSSHGGGDTVVASLKASGPRKS